MTEPNLPGVVESDDLQPDDGVLFDTPTITVDANYQISIEWSKGRPPEYVQMSEPLFTEWVDIMNALRRLSDLLLNVVALEHREHADGSPGRVPTEMQNEINRLKETLRIP